MTDWSMYINEQKDLCKRLAVDFIHADKELRIGIADNIDLTSSPINGLRHSLDTHTSGWFLWVGENFSEASDFFKPHCVKHLEQIRPDIIKYLALPPGYRFLIDNNGYEDVWFDEQLLNV